MKRLLIALVAIAVLASPLSAVAAVKAGDTCKKVGATATVGGKKFSATSGQKSALDQPINMQSFCLPHGVTGWMKHGTK